MIVNEEIYLAHYGVQGMKWGVRRATNKAAVTKLRSKGLTGRQAKATVRYQNMVDAQKMAATGRQGKVNVLRQLNNRMISNMMLGTGTMIRHPLSTKKAATLQLQKNQALQKQIGSGKAKVRNWLFEMRGINIKNINYNLTPKDSRATAAYRKSGPVKALARDAVGAQPKKASPARKPRAGVAVPVI